jgi:hypothetical protein
MSVISLEQVVVELCKETREPGMLNSQTIYGCLLDGIRDLSLHAMPSWSIVEDLSLNDYNAICWPSECVKPLITFLVRDGKSFALDVGDDLISGIQNATNASTFEEADNQINDFFRIDGIGYNGYYNAWNWGLGEVYGYGTGYRSLGVVTHDQSRRQSYVKGVTLKSTDRFGFFCKTDGLSAAPMFVPAEAKEALEYFALAKYYRTRNPNLGELNKKNYKEEFRRLQTFLMDDGLESWSIAFNSGQKSSPKGVQ